MAFAATFRWLQEWPTAWIVRITFQDDVGLPVDTAMMGN